MSFSFNSCVNTFRKDLGVIGNFADNLVANSKEARLQGAAKTAVGFAALRTFALVPAIACLGVKALQAVTVLALGGSLLPVITSLFFVTLAVDLYVISTNMETANTIANFSKPLVKGFAFLFGKEVTREGVQKSVSIILYSGTILKPVYEWVTKTSIEIRNDPRVQREFKKLFSLVNA